MKNRLYAILVVVMLFLSMMLFVTDQTVEAIGENGTIEISEGEERELYGPESIYRSPRMSWKDWLQIFTDISRPLEDYTSREPIRINNDTDFADQATAEGWPGTGIDVDPYVIQGYEIDGEDLGNCIYIGNTTVYFELRDNYVYNASGNNDIYFRRTGIYLHNVTNGTIIGNIGYNNGNHGIYLESSYGNVLEGNTMYENRRGIKLIGESDGNTIRDNVANNNLFGINIRETSSHNLVVNNTVIGNERGIYVNVETDNRLITNTVIIGNIVDYNIDTSWGSGYGISVRSNHFTRRIEYTTIENNTLDGNDIGIYIFRPEHNTVRNNEVKNSTGTGLWFARSDNNIVINNTAINNSGRGFYISRVTSSDFVNNTLINNNQDGVHITGDRTDTTTFPSTGNTITGSIVKNNGRHGIYMDAYTRSNTYSNNTITNNTGSGIYLADQPSDQTRNNHIENNIISLNGEHGIYMCESRLITLLNNTMLGNGIYIEGASDDRWNTHDIDTNNTVDGRPVHYLKDAIGGVVPEGAGQVILASCQGTTVENQELSNATLLLGYSEEIEIRNVTISVPYLHGIFLYSSDLCNITESAFVDAGVSGIYASLSDDLNINKTSVTGSGGSGIHLSSSHRGMVYDNSIYIAGNGLEVESSDNIEITDNAIFSNNRGIYIHSGSEDNFISRNHLFDNNDGLHLNGAGAGLLIYGNNASDNNRHGIYISSSGENIIENNTIASNNDDGIHVRTSVSWIVNNTLSYNGNDGVYIERTANGHMINNTITDSGRWGMYTRGATGWQIKDNFIFGYNHNFAIYKTFIGGPTVRTGGHFISNNTVTGGGLVLLYPNQPSIIEGNTITDYSERGIRLDQFSIAGYSSTGNIVSNNSLVAHPDSTDARGIFVCPECHGTVIENNTIDNGMNGIFIGSVDNLVQRNKVSNLTQFGISTGTSSQNNRIQYNTVLNSHYSIYLRGSDHSVVDNTIKNSSLHGIYAFGLQDALVENNTINGTQDNGIEMYDSSNVELYNNTIMDASPHAIHLSLSTSCTLKGNQMHGTGIMINGWSASNWNSHIIDENNTVNALPVKYRAGITDGNVSGNLGQVIIASCTGMTLSNLTIENGGVAVLLGFADDNLIVNSTFVNNTYGIYLFSSEGNMIYHNNFINNTIQAHDGSSNHWDNGYPSGGNHWSDWTEPDENSGIGQNEPGRDGIVDEPRDIPGGSSRDNYPWTTPGGWDILSPGVVLTSPVGGDAWTGGSDRDITWIATPGNGTIVGVDIEYSLDDGDLWTVIEEGLDDTGSYTWTVPDENSNQVRVRIFVHDDNDRTAHAMSGLFSMASAPSAPRNPQATPGDEKVILQWDAPLDDGGSAITNYTVYRGTEPGNLTELVTLGNVLAYTDHDVINGVTYHYAISAISGIGESDMSEEVSATPATTPSAPQNISATPGDGQIYLEWEPPLSDGGAEITNYTIYRAIEPGEYYLIATIGNVLNYTDMDVESGVTYYYQVIAVNSAGPGNPSHDKPSVPRNLRATSGDQQVLLEWDAPLFNGGTEITNYMIYRGETPGELSILITIGNTLNYTDTDVENGVAYYYAVVSINGAGESDLSEEVSTIPMTTPSAPQDLQATPGDELVILEWNAPLDDGGTTITNYTVYRGTEPGNLTYLVTIGNVLNYTDENVDNGVTYYYQVSAVNSVGEGELSEEVNARPPTTPSAPQNLQATPGDELVILEWNAPLDDGGTTITNYTVYRGTEPGNLTYLVTIGNVLNYTDENVDNGVTYYYQVSAVNSFGEGELTDEVSATPATTPSAPRDLQVTPGDELVVLQWEPPLHDGGAEITNYNIYRGIEPGNLTLLVTIGDVLTYTDENVDNGITYYYQVSAVNWAGEGDLSDEVSATPATIPSAPQNLQATPGDEQVLLEWDAPSDNGGAEITNYTIYRGETPGELSVLITIGNVLNYTDMDVENDVTYYYQVRAVNEVGEGELSAIVSAIPMETNSPPDKPSQPTPEDGTTGINTTITLSVVVTDPDGDMMDVRFRNANDNSLIGESLNVASGETASILWGGLEELTQYSWYVVVDDGRDTTISDTWTFTTGDFTAPVVESTTPDDEETDVAVDSDIIITFTKTMNIDSVENDFSISPFVEGTFSWNDDETVLTYTLVDVMEYSRLYTVNIGSDSKDIHGNHLMEEYSFSFTTVEETHIPDQPPELTIHTPSENDEYELGTAVNITWTATDDLELPSNPITIEISYDGGSNWELLVGEIENTGSYLWIPDEVYTEVLIKITCTDSVGQSTTEYSGIFQVVDTTPPELTRTVPDHEEVNVRISTQITFEFDEEISEQSIYITLMTGTQSLPGNVVLLPGGRTISFTPQELLDYETVYVVNITAEDLHGNSMSREFTFTTENMPEDTEDDGFDILDYWWLIAVLIIGIIAVLLLMKRKDGDGSPKDDTVSSDIEEKDNEDIGSTKEEELHENT